MPPHGLHTLSLADSADPRLADYAGLRRAHLAEEGRAADAAAAAGGSFIAEGDLVLDQLIGSRFPLRSVLVSERRLQSLAPLLARIPAAIPLYTLPQPVMNELVGFNIHRGVLAVAERGPGLEDRAVIAAADVLLVMDDLANHDNVGGIFRCAAALAGPRPGVLLSPRCADPLYRKSVRVSMGHALRVPFAVMHDWPGGVGKLTDAGYEVFGLTPLMEAQDLRLTTRSSRKIALVVGSEGPGLSPTTMEAISALAPGGRLIRIGMTPGVDSLNVMVAAAVALHRLVEPEGAGTGGPGRGQTS